MASLSLRELKEEYTYLLEQMNKNLRRQLDIANATKIPNEGEPVVYVLRQKGTQNYKIGFSTNYQQRKATFDVRLPFEVEEILIYPTKLFRQLEASLHRTFAENRLNGSEFFALTDEQVGTIEGLLNAEEERLASGQPEAEPDSDSPTDPDGILRNQVMELIEEAGIEPLAISTSFIQRKLRIGYARAARLKDWIIETSPKDTEPSAAS